MGFYVDRVFCKGVAPNGIPSFNYERRELISKLLCAKDKPRVIIAPSGYGKTAICASYAELIYSFKDTVWFDCASPCFLRDLDSRRLNETLFAEYDIKLCVFDELPHIPETVIEKFKKLVDDLTEMGIEVLINLAPETRNEFFDDDGYYQLPANSLFVKTNDIESIPALEYPNGEVSNLFDSMRSYGLYRNEMLVYYCALMLQEGTFEEIEEFCDKRFVKKTLETISSYLPHLRVDFVKKKFKCVCIGVKDIRDGFGYAKDELIATSKLINDEEFFCLMAKVLADKGEWQRAKEVALNNFKVQDRLRWAINNATDFTDRHRVHDIVECLATSSQQMNGMRDEIHSCLCHIFCEIDSPQRAINCATKVLCSRKSTNSMKGYVALLACFYCERERLVDYEEMMIEFMGAGEVDSYFEKPFSSLRFSKSDLNLLKDFIVVWNQDSIQGLVFLMNKIDEHNERGASACSEAACCFCARYVLNFILEDGRNNKSFVAAIRKTFQTPLDFSEIHEMIGCLIRFCFDCLKLSDSGHIIPIEVLNASSVALELCEELCSDYLKFADSVVIEVVKDHRKLDERIRTYADSSWTKSTSTLVRESEDIRKNVNESIKFSFFGGFSVTIDERLVACELAKRKNCVYFLFLLCENLGHDLTRELLTDKIWPDHMSVDSCRRNFYNTLNVIRRMARKITDVEFVMKSATGYRLDPNYCISDLQEFANFCNYLNFNAEMATRNMTLVAENITHFSMPLLPQIAKIPRINDLRITFRSQLVDALVLASLACLEIRDYRNTLWFARKAKDIDHNREDAYYLIMKAQNGLNLRSSAVSTFFECKNVLDQELGILPSSEIRNLYQTVIS